MTDVGDAVAGSREDMASSSWASLVAGTSVEASCRGMDCDEGNFLNVDSNRLHLRLVPLVFRQM